jgi:hypothetical protein
MDINDRVNVTVAPNVTVPATILGFVRVPGAPDSESDIRVEFDRAPRAGYGRRWCVGFDKVSPIA